MITGSVHTNRGVVKCLYLEPEDWDVFQGHLKTNAETHHEIWNEIAQLYELMGQIFGDQIVAFYKEQIKAMVRKFGFTTSYRYADITEQLSMSWHLEALRSKALDEVVREGLLEYRGAGWYRRAKI